MKKRHYLMHLGFHYHVPATAKGEEIYMPGYQGRFIDNLAQHCESITCFLHSPTPQEEKLLDYKIQSPKVRLIDLGTHTSIPKRLLRSHQITKTFKRNIQNLDILLLRAPTPLLPFIVKATGNLPISLLVVGDNLSGVDELNQPFLRKEFIRLFWAWNKFWQINTAKHSLTFVNSHKLYDKLKDWAQNLVETRTTTLSQHDFFEREDTCQSPPYHLLYTGRIEKAKGLFELVEAMALLIQKGCDVILDIVGWAAEGDQILEELKALAKEKDIQERIIFHGFKSLGDELFQMYKNADIYVLASYAEGFPRTIWEAMANCLPVVATKVGSIPLYLKNKHSAILISQKDASALSQAIFNLLNSPDMRRKIIRNGFQLAQENTLEIRSLEMINKMQYHLAVVKHE